MNTLARSAIINLILRNQSRAEVKIVAATQQRTPFEANGSLADVHIDPIFWTLAGSTVSCFNPPVRAVEHMIQAGPTGHVTDHPIFFPLNEFVPRAREGGRNMPSVECV